MQSMNVTKQKTDGVKHMLVFHPVGLRCNSTPGRTGLHFTSSANA